MNALWKQGGFPHRGGGAAAESRLPGGGGRGVLAAETLASLESNPFILTAGQAWHCVWKAFLGRALFDWQTGLRLAICKVATCTDRQECVCPTGFFASGEVSVGVRREWE